MPAFHHADGGLQWRNVRLQMRSNKSWKIGSFQMSSGMLSRPGDFGTFKVLVTALNSSMENSTNTNTNRRLTPTREHTRVVGDCLGVYISSFIIFKLHQILTIYHFSKFYYSFEKNYLLPNIPKNHQKINANDVSLFN